MKLHMLASVVLLCGCATAFAADDQYKSCIDATDKNDEWAACGGELIKRSESRMDGYLQRLRQIAEGNTLKLIEIEQAAWSGFRDAACQFYADQEAFGREGQVLSYPLCKADLIDQRAEQLRDYLRQIDP